MFGKLTWSAIPFDEPIPLITSAFVLVAILGVIGWVTVKGYGPICGASGSLRPTTRGSASCTSCLRW